MHIKLNSQLSGCGFFKSTTHSPGNSICCSGSLKKKNKNKKKKKGKLELPYDPAILLLGIYPKEWKARP